MSKTIYTSILSLFFTVYCFAANVDLNTVFKNYQSGNFDAAQTILADAVKENPQNSYLLYNLGLTEYNRGKVGLALALWRKALFINPSLSDAKKALSFAQDKMPTSRASLGEDSSLVWIMNLISNKVSINLAWPILLLFVVLFFRKLFRYLALKKKAFLQDDPAPAFSLSIPAYGIAMILALLISLVVVSNMIQTRATIITSGVQAKTGPGEENASVFDIPEGTELLLTEKRGDWYKAEDPSGRMGWVPGSSFYITTENHL